MKYEFKVFQMQVEEHVFWVAKSTALKGCVGQGDTVQEAIAELEANESEWLTTAAECGIPIPLPSVQKKNAFSGKVSLRFSAFTHEEASENAKALGVSLNQYINDAIVYYNGTVNNKRSAKQPLFVG
ncbi:MAG: toxin-antitoxin system HicB family antitoxin [Bacteroidales bacterium]|nr:toxin-antitoxin system HicB family antitoxin [Bacteroidales bacterium]MCM1415408.1 toxin-antitoxin system HicB family antitoxin [bacterium]MCM1423341.1 toxin-antitoxin system HicB family antitoxin [bacterium]